MTKVTPDHAATRLYAAANLKGRDVACLALNSDEHLRNAWQRVAAEHDRIVQERTSDLNAQLTALTDSAPLDIETTTTDITPGCIRVRVPVQARKDGQLYIHWEQGLFPPPATTVAWITADVPVPRPAEVKGRSEPA